MINIGAVNEEDVRGVSTNEQTEGECFNGHNLIDED